MGAPVQKVLSPKTASRPRWVGGPAQLLVYLSLAYLPGGSCTFQADETRSSAHRRALPFMSSARTSAPERACAGVPAVLLPDGPQWDWDLQNLKVGHQLYIGLTERDINYEI